MKKRQLHLSGMIGNGDGEDTGILVVPLNEQQCSGIHHRVAAVEIIRAGQFPRAGAVFDQAAGAAEAVVQIAVTDAGEGQRAADWTQNVRAKVVAVAQRKFLPRRRRFQRAAAFHQHQQASRARLAGLGVARARVLKRAAIKNQPTGGRIKIT